jgi:hypothetical protein
MNLRFKRLDVIDQIVAFPKSEFDYLVRKDDGDTVPANRTWCHVVCGERILKDFLVYHENREQHFKSRNTLECKTEKEVTRFFSRPRKLYPSSCHRCSGKGVYFHYGVCLRCSGHGLDPTDWQYVYPFEWSDEKISEWNKKREAANQKRRAKAEEKRLAKHLEIVNANEEKCPEIEAVSTYRRQENRLDLPPILQDIHNKSSQYILSDKQCDLFRDLWKKFNEHLEEIANNPSTHRGEIGEKLGFLFTVDFTVECENQFGSTLLVKGSDEDGNVYVTFYSGTTYNPEEGETYFLKGSVKAHDDYRGVPQTVLTRCKFLSEQEAVA